MTSFSKYLLVIVVISIVLVNVTVAVADGQWTRSGSNPILSPPSWASGGLIRPRVVYDGTTFRMWFSGLNAQGAITGGIGYATSADGMKWVQSSQPVLTPGIDWEGTYISIGSVIWTGSKFMMWYRGVGGRQGSSQANGAVGLATSIDGVTWTKYFANPVMATTVVDSEYITNPYVIQVGSSFKMWYSCLGGGLAANAICYATSTDGISWTKQSAPVLIASLPWEISGLYSPSVIYDGTTYGMWYSASNRTGTVPNIGFATSKDGIAWTPSPNNPIFGPGPTGAWDSGGVENQCVIQSNNGFWLYYDGVGTSKTSLNYIGLAQSPAGFALPETPSPALTAIIAMMALIIGLSFSKRSSSSTLRLFIPSR